MVESKIEVILIESRDDEPMKEANGEVVQEEPTNVQMKEGF